MDLGLEGKVAIVTGGSDGIGKAAAISMASEGAKVAIVGRTQTKLDAAVAEIKEASGGEAIGISADVSVESDVKAMVDKVVAEYGKLDILVNNAGTSSATTLENMTDEDLKVDFGIKSGQHRTRWEAANAKDSSYTLEDHWKVIGKNVPMGRVGEAQEAGDLICFLASAKASYITGTAVNVDGGTSPVV